MYFLLQRYCFKVVAFHSVVRSWGILMHHVIQLLQLTLFNVQADLENLHGRSGINTNFTFPHKDVLATLK